MAEIWGAAIAAVGVVGGAALSADASRKAQHSAQDAAKASQVNISDLDQQTRQIALQNAKDSAALEASMTPEVPALRREANNAVLSGLSDTSMDRSKSILNSQLGTSLNTPLLNEAIAKARADLALGGKLDQDTQNAVTRKGLATAGTVGGGLGLGRDVVARDLGLTSAQLEQQRIANAMQGGGLELNAATDNSANLLNQIGLLQNINSNQRGYALGAAQYGESIKQPIVGLDPTAVANISIGNSNGAAGALSNQANIYGQQGANYANLAGQIAGYGINAYSKSTSAPKTTTQYKGAGPY